MDNINGGFKTLVGARDCDPSFPPHLGHPDSTAAHALRRPFSISSLTQTLKCYTLIPMLAVYFHYTRDAIVSPFRNAVCPTLMQPVVSRILCSACSKHAHAGNPYYFCRGEIASLSAIRPIVFPGAPVAAPAPDIAVARRQILASGGVQRSLVGSGA